MSDRVASSHAAVPAVEVMVPARPASATRSSRQERAKRLLPVPLAAYLASTLLAWATAALSGEEFWSLAARERWDSVHYLSIASRGYEMFRCRERYPKFPDVWCGNTAWFPGYPMVTRVVSWTGLPVDVSAVLVTELCLVAVFVLLWHLLGARLTPGTGAAMALAVVFPGAIYFHAVFPVTLGALGLLICVLGIQRESLPYAGVGAWIAFSTHLVGGRTNHVGAQHRVRVAQFGLAHTCGEGPGCGGGGCDGILASCRIRVSRDRSLGRLLGAPARRLRSGRSQESVRAGRGLLPHPFFFSRTSPTRTTPGWSSTPATPTRHSSSSTWSSLR